MAGGTPEPGLQAGPLEGPPGLYPIVGALGLWLVPVQPALDSGDLPIGGQGLGPGSLSVVARRAKATALAVSGRIVYMTSDSK